MIGAHVRTTDSSFCNATGFMDAVRPILPNLRSYARRLTGNGADGDDLVQDTLTRAWKARDRFEAGTNLKAWMMRIERNSFLSGRQRDRRCVDLDSELMERRLVEGPRQEEAIHFANLDRAIEALSAGQREAFRNVAGGQGYKQAAEKLGIAESTLKSRVSRARAALVRALESGPTAVIANDHSSSLRMEGVDYGEAETGTIYEAWKRSGSRTIG